VVAANLTPVFLRNTSNFPISFGRLYLLCLSCPSYLPTQPFSR